MSSNISVVNENLIAEVGKNGISSVLKPLTKEIKLIECNLQCTELADPSIIKKLSVAEKLTLRIDKDNIFDSSAVGVYDANSNIIGYIPSWVSPVPNNLINAGKLVIAKVLSSRVLKLDDGTIATAVKAEVILVDF